jgi:hypothetical protein
MANGPDNPNPTRLDDNLEVLFGDGGNDQLLPASLDHGQSGEHPLKLLPPAAVTASVTILSLGMVLGILEFIWLAFRYPDSANVLVTLVMLPMIRSVGALLKARKKK